MNRIDRLVLLISKRNGRFHHARGMHRNRRIVLQHIAQRRNRLPYVYLGAYGQGASLLRGGQAQYGPRTDGEAGGAGRFAGATVTRPVIEPYQS